MSRSTKSVFNNIQVNGTMTYVKRKIKNSQQPGELNLPNARHIIFLFFSWKDWESSRKFFAQQNGLVLFSTTLCYPLQWMLSNQVAGQDIKVNCTMILGGEESGWEVKYT